MKLFSFFKKSKSITFDELFEKFWFEAFENQKIFFEKIWEKNWNYDLENKIFTIWDNITFPLEILGTLSHHDETFLWAWENPGLKLHEKVIQKSLELKKFWEKEKIDIFSIGKWEISNEFFHKIAAVSVWFFDLGAYFVADYGSGAMLVVVPKWENPNPKSPNGMEIISNFMEFISHFEVHHKNALTNYLKNKNIKFSEKNNEMIIGIAEITLRATFDEMGRITKFEVI